MDNFFKIITITSIIIGIVIIIGEICNTQDRIIKRTPDYIYVMEYSLYDLDSTINKYRATKTYIGTVSAKNRNYHFVGVPGKGGHYETDYDVTIRFNNTEIEENDRKLYDKYHVGDKIQVTESWYPYHKIIVK